MKLNNKVIGLIVTGVIIVISNIGTYCVMNNKINTIEKECDAKVNTVTAECNAKVEKYQDDILDYKKEIFELKNPKTKVNLENYKDTELSAGNYIVGKDIEAGVYNIVLNNNVSGSVVMINDKSGNYIDGFNIGTLEDSGYDTEIKNIELKEGQQIEVGNGLNVVFKVVGE